MWPLFIVLVTVSSTWGSDIQLNGHIEVGDSIVKLFNGIVDQLKFNLQPNQDTRGYASGYSNYPTNHGRGEHPPVGQAETDAVLVKKYQIIANNADMERAEATGTEETILQKLLRHQFPETVHLYVTSCTADTGIRVKGQIEMGDNILQLFNGIVQNLKINQMDPSRETGRQVQMIKNYDNDLTRSDTLEKEEPLLESLLRHQGPEMVHLYGSHKYDGKSNKVMI